MVIAWSTSEAGDASASQKNDASSAGCEFASDAYTVYTPRGAIVAVLQALAALGDCGPTQWSTRMPPTQLAA